MKKWRRKDHDKLAAFHYAYDLLARLYDGGAGIWLWAGGYEDIEGVPYLGANESWVCRFCGMHGYKDNVHRANCPVPEIRDVIRKGQHGS